MPIMLRILPAGLVLGSLLLAGCDTSCTTACRAVLECDLDSDRVSTEECVESCQRQESLYELWEDDTKADAFAEHRSCLADSTCDELADGACYDPELFIF